MSNQILKLPDQQPLVELEQISTELKALGADIQSEALEAALTARAISEIKKRLTPDIVKGFTYLQNTSLGFKTDKRDSGYDEGTIKDCLIQAFIRKVKVTGNEFNIIAGQFYITKEGFQGLMARDPSFSDVVIEYGIPVLKINDRRAIIHCKATWKYNGKKDSLESDFSIQLKIKNGINYITDDAIIGKAERKMRKRIWEKATGDSLPDGDLTEEQRAERATPVGPDATATTVDMEFEEEAK